ncbi:exported hypothetical protein [Desulfamplus magnetovallimortis]|uniref:Uncharacterized protein n=1 Tax=Desulfamplus magnetovallimortis TaxID=1246637 RepID=A0A1W1H6L1_9BACT|nr:hypothetical protein [Desulfamplus magnetovallimortis]SLM28097.1 exported hypothetical protein [Desulfamplus magnetovallimortis]
MKKSISIIIITITAMVAQTLFVSSAHAGRSRGDDVLKGVIIGTGAAIIGAAIVSEISHSRDYNHDRNNHHKWDRDRKHRDHNHHKPCDGYWKIEKIWIPPVYDKRWNPGHYNKRGRWVKGQYDMVIVRGGHWEERKIWISRR